MLIAPLQATENPGGLVGFAETLIIALGEWGVAILVFIETVFPPIPSEIILALAGYVAYQGELNVVLTILLATLGGYAGALVLYSLGRTVGEERTIRWLSKLPLVYREDFEKASAWFKRHGRASVFFGRLMPIVRSLISLPAGAAKMPLVEFSVFTLLGSTIWNTLLVGGGFLLGTQYELVDEYAHYLDYVIYAAIIGFLAFLIIRRIRRGRTDVHGTVA